jgi:hypothetical protein
MAEHILITLSTKKPFNEHPELIKGMLYNSSKGYWMIGNKRLVSYDSEYGVQVTKKCDIETGEDQKGE